MYSISDIVHTHRLLFTCNYELCILYSIAHYSRTYMFLSGRFNLISYAYRISENVCNYKHSGNFFCESVTEARGQEWRPQ